MKPKQNSKVEKGIGSDSYIETPPTTPTFYFPFRVMGTSQKGSPTPNEKNQTQNEIQKKQRLTREERTYEKFKKVIGTSKIDLDKLRSLAWNGVPATMRAETWKILLGYLPVSRVRHEGEEQSKRSEYRSFVTQYYEQQGMERTLGEQQLLQQIEKDVPRTHPSPFFKHPQVCKSMERILYISSLKQPACGYVQGHDTILTVFFTVLMASFLNCHSIQKLLHEFPLESITSKIHEINDLKNESSTSLKTDTNEQPQLSSKSMETLIDIEADIFYCFNKFLVDIQDFYTHDVPGIARSLNKLEQLVAKINPKLAQHMKKLQEFGEGLHYMQFAYRWMNCLLLRELPLDLGVRLLDTYIAEGSNFVQLHIFVCVAFMDYFATEIMTLDYFGAIQFFQHLPSEKWQVDDLDTVLSQAYVYQNTFLS